MARSKGVQGIILALTFKPGGAITDSSDTFVHLLLPDGEVVQRQIPVSAWHQLKTGDTYMIEGETR